jgi:Lipase (class 3)
MGVSNELMLALLSMDSYNRGYGEGISGLGGVGSQLGNANFSSQSATGSSSAEVAVGFYASAYNWNGKTVISYRGTDNPSVFTNANGVSDVLNGWITAAGVPNSSASLALQFYNSVTGSNYQAGPAANTVLTGHSLGGGMSGFAAA